MRIQLASDLHLEMLQQHFPGERLIAPAPDADVLVLAGDIGNGLQAVTLFRDWPVPVLYVLGNHEPYGHELHQLRLDLAAAVRGTPIALLDNNGLTFDGVRFLGCTLWTDYRLRLNRTQRQLMEHAELHLNDHRLIRCGHRVFTAEDALAEHEASRTWLESQLGVPFTGRTVVVTHHGPHSLSTHPRYAGDALNAAFVSNLEHLLPGADTWLHGHVHDNVDYRLGPCRVVANPRGYPLNLRRASTVGNIVFENSQFDGALLIDV
jgi:predicted phosphodiesterase